MRPKLRDQFDPEKIVPRRFGAWLLLPLVLMVMVVFVFARQWRDALPIEKVAVEGARILSAEDVAAMTAIQRPAFMFGIDLYGAQERLLAQPYIKEAAVARELPHTLRISIIEREPIASLAGNALRYVDAEGVLLPRLASAVQFDVPVISGIGGLNSAAYGKPVNDSDLAQAIGVLQSGQAAGFYHAISEVHVAPGEDIILYPTDGGVPVILGRGEIAKKMLVLQTFWAGFMKPNMLADLQYIDARFDGQIVVKRLKDSSVTKKLEVRN